MSSTESVNTEPSEGEYALPSEGLAFINGDVVALEEARIPLMDTGFLRSDVTYDALATWHGRFFRLDDHLERFAKSCAALRLQPAPGGRDLANMLHDLVAATGLSDTFVEMICTRGVARKGSRDPRHHQNRLYAFVSPYVWLLPWSERDSGMDAVITRTVERIAPRAVDPTVKNFHWGDLTRGLYEAYDRGARYPILLSADGLVTEGSGYNVFAVVDGRLMTPQSGVLEGITRRTVLDLASGAGIECAVCDVPPGVLERAEELFATSTAGGVMAITSVDGRPVGDGSAGRITRRLRDLYWEAHDDLRYTRPVGKSAGRDVGAASTVG